MKKGLSILLIAAALFGFYGGATSLNDVLASKDYWEKKGEETTADMNKLEDGLNQLGDNKQAYLDGLDTLAEGEQALEEGKKTLAQGEADYAAAPAKLRAGEVKLAAGKAAYKSGKAQYDAGKKEYNEKKAQQEELRTKLGVLEANYKKWHAGYEKVAAAADAGKLTSDYWDANTRSTKWNDANESVYQGARTTFNNTAQALGSEQLDADGSNIETAGPALVVAQGNSAYNTAYENYKTQHAGEADVEEKAKEAGNSAKVFAMNKIKTELVEPVTGAIGVRTVFKGERTMADAINTLAKDLMKNEDAVKALGGKDKVKAILDMINSGIDPQFDVAVAGLIDKAKELIKDNDAKLAAAAKQLKDAEKQLAAGKKEIKAGEAKLAQGYADYEAAPAKLAAGRQALADGLKQIEDGKKKLAEYEDGEQQVRDGLATLMSTEPDGGLVSILDRRNGDDNFDDAQGHLDVDEGLDAVEVGRGYQADSGELITKEITGRAVGTAAGLGAAVLAVLAAILSFAKKYKGAAVSAILAAAAGCAGALVGNNAGDEFSNIAGSTVGATPWIAAGVLAAVALVFAIAHFTAKPEA